jgi:hypothetical protein
MSTKMPYAASTSFTFNGQTYADEKAACRAAIEHAIGNLGVAAQVISECCALVPLLTRACELGMGTPPWESKE